ncbi:hypothetical protein CLV24_11852 [Pontibacter ummariensis]|uniref:Viral A-type inclusion protein n=1 Tax=Pontibacter ummariensis TaxID=1610492 RepID=A0A239INK1_9BACT|nr:hypothetical protein [Pontibacter ummariensis]PRY09713.1 hypothetical protein CLV24_11852 [Pontibacter ummariensis]SNS95346.1 hypothetical protein SAMN06296052_11836 [Pontibacter ummariensis]
MKNRVMYLAFPLALLLSCHSGPTEETQQAELQGNVMAIHDAAMAKMEDIFKLRRSLRALRDTLEAQQADSTTLLVLQRDISGLNEADEVMMSWMRQYQAPDSLQHQEAMAYLQAELQKIERVQTVMDSTIQAARTTLTQYDQQK